MEKLPEILKQYQPLNLEGLKEAHLMNRVDTKFIVSISKLPQIISALANQYFILEINGHRNTHYQNLYFDTPQNQFFLSHHNGRDHRFKVRFRRYENTDTTFLEVKKRRKKRTTKERIHVDRLQDKLSEKEQLFVANNLGEIGEINPSLLVEYTRITLVNKDLDERFTLDYEIQFSRTHDNKNINHVVIAELKQQKLNKYSPAYQLMNQIKVNPTKFSKYCIGMVMLSSEGKIKYNNFKKTLLQLDKLKTQ